MARILLPENVQFMYEHALAHMEFVEGFGVRALKCAPEDPWQFEGSLDGHVDALLQRSAYVESADDRRSVYSELIRPSYKGGEYNRTRSVNQYLTHWIYPYKGKFHPQMIRAILNIIRTAPGDVVLDPFVGSGTAALEAQLLGLDFIGVDASPLCVKLSKVKTGAWARAKEISAVVSHLLSRRGDPSLADLVEIPARGLVRDFLDIARLITASDVVRRNRHLGRSLRRNLRKMLQSVEDMAAARAKFHLHFGQMRVVKGDARNLRRLRLSNQAVDAIVTSPPYSIALDYIENDMAALQELGVDIPEMRNSMIGVRGRSAKDRLERYNEDMKKALAEMSRVLKPGGSCVIIIGDATVRGQEKTTTRDIVEWARRRGLVLEREMRKIVYGLYSIITRESILFLRKL